VFIAMVLVAATAAGVLINTTGFLQTESEETNGLQVSAAVGSNIGNSEVGTVNVTVKKSPDANNIDLENATVQWVGPSGTYSLVNASVSAAGADGHFGVVTFKDADDSHPVLNDPDDRMVVVFDLGADDTPVDNAGTGTGTAGVHYFGDALPEGASVTLQITAKSGATTTEQLTVPETLSGSTAVQL